MPDEPLPGHSRYPIKILFDIDWRGDVARRIVSAVKRMGKWEILLRTVGRKGAHLVQQNLNESHTPEGERFEPLKRPRPKGHNPIPIPLLDTYRLRDNIDWAIRSSDTVAVGIKPPAFYGRFHDRANEYNVRFPERHFLGIADRDAPQFEPDVAAHVRSSFDVSGAEFTPVSESLE